MHFAKDVWVLADGQSVFVAADQWTHVDNDTGDTDWPRQLGEHARQGTGDLLFVWTVLWECRNGRWFPAVSPACQLHGQQSCHLRFRSQRSHRRLCVMSDEAWWALESAGGCRRYGQQLSSLCCPTGRQQQRSLGCPTGRQQLSDGVGFCRKVSALWELYISDTFQHKHKQQQHQKHERDERRQREHSCPFSGVTKSGRVWRKAPESGARSVHR